MRKLGQDRSGLQYLYGPVPSRRLGRSLGVDLVPFKTCTYDCVYCQLGPTTCLTTERRNHADTDGIIDELEWKLASAGTPDTITLAGSGEPTLHSGIGGLIDRIKTVTRIPVTVLTNGSLLWMPEVREALMEADRVIPSLDAGDEQTFKTVNRPHPGIDFERMVDGLAAFTAAFKGAVWLEVFLLKGVTDKPAQAASIAACSAKIRPSRIQLNTVTRPAPDGFARAVPREALEALAERFDPAAEVIAAYRTAGPVEGDTVSEEEIRGLLARRPCTLEDIAAGLAVREMVLLKQLDEWMHDGIVRVVAQDGKCLYVLTGTQGSTD
ncbi:radical SAM protein [bacterium]|nr:radical SAM protein [bacterium]